MKKPSKTDRQRIAALERDFKKLLTQCSFLEGAITGLWHALAGKADRDSIDPVTGGWI